MSYSALIDCIDVARYVRYGIKIFGLWYNVTNYTIHARVGSKYSITLQLEEKIDNEYP